MDRVRLVWNRIGVVSSRVSFVFFVPVIHSFTDPSCSHVSLIRISLASGVILVESMVSTD